MTLVLLDTNTYLRLAKRIRPLLGVKFGQKDYVLTVLKDVEDEVRRNRTLRSRFPWFDDEAFGAERDAAQIRLNAAEKTALGNAHSVLRGHVLTDVDRYTTGRRDPPSDTDCRVLAFGQVRDAIVVTDDLGMHLLAADFELPIWHGWELLAKMKAAKKVDNDLIRDIYDALECNGDLTVTWLQAKHTEFARIFGPRRG
ncbi:hypothetical protein [Methylibium sp.]|uniref:hypothetical protein n=1 Tax=Methylibium sp. TaxID=2067992 RepID=UPI003D0AE5AA